MHFRRVDRRTAFRDGFVILILIWVGPGWINLVDIEFVDLKIAGSLSRHDQDNETLVAIDNVCRQR